MQMPEFSVQCGGCGTVLAETAQQVERKPCPNCGSGLRQINVSVTDEMSVKEQVGMKAKDATLSGKKKIRIEQLVGDDLHQKSGKWYKKVRVIDRENDRYFEEVVDPETGAIIHRCDEPLSEHFGHGSARLPREDSESTGGPQRGDA